jgi:hypothetical protein
MGIYHPRIGLRNYTELPAGEAGSVGFIGQSGTPGILSLVWRRRRGVKISKAVSFGNAAVIDASDHLDYLASDEEAHHRMHLEGAREGRRFFSLLREVTKEKAGGDLERRQQRTQPARHLFAYWLLAVPAAVWGAMVRQARRHCGRDL